MHLWSNSRIYLDISKKYEPQQQHNLPIRANLVVFCRIISLSKALEMDCFLRVFF